MTETHSWLTNTTLLPQPPRRQWFWAIGAVVVLLVCFVMLGACVAPTDRCLTFDQALFRILIDQTPPTLSPIMRVGRLVSDLSIIVALSLIGWLAIGRRIKMAVLALMAESSLYLVHLVLKALYQRTRPGDELVDPLPSDFLFPSGHAVAAMLTYILLAYVLSTGRSRTISYLVGGLAGLLIGLTGVSLTYYGFHYATDVIGSLLLGGAWSIITIRLGRELGGLEPGLRDLSHH